MTVSDINTQSVASPTAAASPLPTCSPCPPTPPKWKPEQCPPPAPATTPDPTTSSNPDYDTFVAVNAALSNATGVAIKNELNKNEIALNDYFIIKPPLLRTLHDSDPCRIILPNIKTGIQINKAKNCYSFLDIMKIVNDRKHCLELLVY